MKPILAGKTCGRCGLALPETNRSGHCRRCYSRMSEERTKVKSPRLEHLRNAQKKERTCLWCDRPFMSRERSDRKCPKCRYKQIKGDLDLFEPQRVSVPMQLSRMIWGEADGGHFE